MSTEEKQTLIKYDITPHLRNIDGNLLLLLYIQNVSQIIWLHTTW